MPEESRRPTNIFERKMEIAERNRSPTPDFTMPKLKGKYERNVYRRLRKSLVCIPEPLPEYVPESDELTHPSNSYSRS